MRFQFSFESSVKSCVLASVLAYTGMMSGCSGCNQVLPPVTLTWPDAPSAAAPIQPLASQANMTAAERNTFYHTAEGSEFFPLTWLLALTDKKTGKPFVENLGRFGLIPDEKSDINPAGLPIGLTTAVPRGIPAGIQFTGVNCAACHVGQIDVAGKHYRVDGAPNMFDVEAFFGDSIDSALAIFSSADEFWNFLRRYSAYASALKEEEQADAPANGGPTNALAAGATALAAGAEDPRLRKHTKELIDKKDFAGMKKGSPIERALAAEIEDEVRRTTQTPITKLEVIGERLRSDFAADVAAHHNRMKLAAPGASESELAEADETIKDVIEDVRLFFDRVKFYASRGGTAQGTPGGFGRTDAWGTVRNLVFDKTAPANAPICFPHLWGFDKTLWLHWIGNTVSVMERNIGQAMGLTAITDMTTYSSTVILPNLNTLESLAHKIQTPKWSDTNLPPIDEKKRAAGEPIFKKLCFSCHENAKIVAGFEDLTMVTAESIGTDATQVVNFAKPVTVGGVVTPFPAALETLLSNVEAKGYADDNISKELQIQWEFGRPSSKPEWRGTMSYIARPLAGIWASAPYLHNGSVPTLDALLRPSRDPGALEVAKAAVVAAPAPGLVTRPATFGIGTRDYDAAKVGYRTDDTTRQTFNTQTTGNSNSGHEGIAYGTTLSEDDRAALLEYLKSL